MTSADKYFIADFRALGAVRIDDKQPNVDDHLSRWKRLAEKSWEAVDAARNYGFYCDVITFPGWEDADDMHRIWHAASSQANCGGTTVCTLGLPGWRRCCTDGNIDRGHLPRRCSSRLLANRLRVFCSCRRCRSSCLATWRQNNSISASGKKSRRLSEQQLVTEYGEGTLVKLPDGSRVVDRPGSKSGERAIKIQNSKGKKKIEVRFPEPEDTD